MGESLCLLILLLHFLFVGSVLAFPEWRSYGNIGPQRSVGNTNPQPWKPRSAITETQVCSYENPNPHFLKPKSKSVATCVHERKRVLKYGLLATGWMMTTEMLNNTRNHAE